MDAARDGDRPLEFAEADTLFHQAFFTIAGTSISVRHMPLRQGDYLP
jgi:hypothetical protein